MIPGSICYLKDAQNGLEGQQFRDGRALRSCSNYTLKGYHLGGFINCCQWNDTETTCSFANGNEVNLSNRHILPSRRKWTSDSWQPLPEYSWLSQMAPCHLTLRNKERLLQIRWRDKSLIKRSLITAGSLIIFLVPESHQYLKATKQFPEMFLIFRMIKICPEN